MQVTHSARHIQLSWSLRGLPRARLVGGAAWPWLSNSIFSSTSKAPRDNWWLFLLTANVQDLSKVIRYFKLGKSLED